MVKKATPPGDDDGAATADVAGGMVVIAVEPVDWEAAGLPDGAQIVKIPFRALTRPLLTETRATTVLGPLWSPELDAMQIAERLGELGFTGKMTVLGPALPNPSLVAREIRSASGSKAFTVELKALP